MLVFIVLASIRMFYPYELEWSESAAIAEVHWIVEGNALYAPPTINFLALPYSPVYYYLSAVTTKLIGPGFLAPRLISILATVGCFALLYAIVYQKTRRYEAGLLAAGVYAASFRFTGAWMDLAKTDSLFLMLILLAFWVSTRHQKNAGLLLSGGLFALAYYTKQITLPVALVLAPISLLVTLGRTWQQWLTMLALGAGLFWVSDGISDGWYSFYTFDTLIFHERVQSLWQFWASLLGKMWPAVLLLLLYAVQVYHSARQNISRFKNVPWLELGFAGALIIASWSIHLKVWVYDNGLMPACIGLALLSGLAYGNILSMRNNTSLSRFNPAGIPLFAIVLLLIQFGFLFYNPVQQIPTSENREQTQDFIKFVQNLPGKVWVFSHTEYGHLASKETYFHSAPFGDVVGGRVPPAGTDVYDRREMVAQVFQDAISSQHFDWIIVDKLEPYWEPYYAAVDYLPYEFYPVTGALTRPHILLTKAPAEYASHLKLVNKLNTGY